MLPLLANLYLLLLIPTLIPTRRLLSITGSTLRLIGQILRFSLNHLEDLIEILDFNNGHVQSGRVNACILSFLSRTGIAHKSQSDEGLGCLPGNSRDECSLIG